MRRDRFDRRNEKRSVRTDLGNMNDKGDEPDEKGIYRCFNRGNGLSLEKSLPWKKLSSKKTIP